MKKKTSDISIYNFYELPFFLLLHFQVPDVLVHPTDDAVNSGNKYRSDGIKNNDVKNSD